jgi:hypothetical protein
VSDVREVQVTFDCADPGALAAFWAEVLGYVVQPPPEGFESWDAFLDQYDIPAENRNDRSAAVDPEGNGPRLFFQKVPEGKVVKNRVHLDVRSAPGLQGDERMAALDAVAERLERLGGKQLERHEGNGMDQGIIIMADPEGNEFCLD